MSRVQNRGDIGPVEKNRVSRHFEITPDMLFTTTGAHTKAALQPEMIYKNVNRPETTAEYAGVAGVSNPAHYVKGQYMDSTNINLGALPVHNAHARGKGGMRDADYESRSATIYNNNRVANAKGGDTYFGGFGGAIGAALAPLMDVLRPSRRENAVGNLRPYQNAKGNSNSYVFNPHDKPDATIRDTTIGKQHLNVNAQKHGAYGVVGVELADTQRASTSRAHVGNSSAGAHARQPRTYDAEYNRHHNESKTAMLTPYTPSGGMSLLNGNLNVTSKVRSAETPSSRAAISTRATGAIPSTETMGRVGGGAQAYQDLDRANPNVLDQLKQNPYFLSVTNGL
jgi:hypothetical protein